MFPSQLERAVRHCRLFGATHTSHVPPPLAPGSFQSQITRQRPSPVASASAIPLFTRRRRLDPQSAKLVFVLASLAFMSAERSQGLPPPFSAKCFALLSQLSVVTRLLARNPQKLEKEDIHPSGAASSWGSVFVLILSLSSARPTGR